MKIFFRITFGAVMWLAVSAGVSLAQTINALSPKEPSPLAAPCVCPWPAVSLPPPRPFPEVGTLPVLDLTWSSVADEAAIPGNLLFGLRLDVPIRYGSQMVCDDPAIVCLVERLSDLEEGTRQFSALKLGKMRATNSLGALLRTLREDPSAKVRLAATKALARIGSAEALPALAEAVDRDRDLEVRRYAEFAVEMITGDDPLHTSSSAVEIDLKDYRPDW